MKMQSETQTPIPDGKWELIQRGKETVNKLKEYKLSHPRIHYLSASYLGLDSNGIYVSRKNINKNKIPIDKYERLVDEGEKRLKEEDDKFDALLQKFSEDIAEFCLSSDAPMSKFDIRRNLVNKKKEDLAKLCSDKIPVHNRVESFSLGLDKSDTNISVRISFVPYSDEGFECHVYSSSDAFLNAYQDIKVELEEILDYMFKPKEGGN